LKKARRNHKPVKRTPREDRANRCKPVDPFVRLTILSERDPMKARAAFVEAFYDKIDDQAACDRFEEIIENAICAGDWEIEIPIELAEILAVVLKTRARPHGGPRTPRRDKLTERTIIGAVLKRKTELIDGGMGRKHAHHRAKIDLDPSTLFIKSGRNLSESTIDDRLARAEAQEKKAQKTNTRR
jgi:hypothetical protein